MKKRGLLRAAAGHQFARFLAVGVLNTAFGYGCFALFLWLGLHYSLALLLATVLGILFNFKSTGSLVFRSRDNRLLARFVGAYALVYACNVTAVGLLVKSGLSPQVAGAITLLPMAVLAFVLQKRFVFVAP